MKKLCNVNCVMFNVIMLFTLHVTHYTAYAQPVSSVELITNAKRHNNEVVTYHGEVVGDIMIRGKNAWINIYDGVNAIGIWAPETFVKDIKYAGGYDAKGDIIEVTGIFNQRCTEHGGDLDIHAQSINIINPGNKILHKLNISALEFGLILFCMILLVFLLKTRHSSKASL